jgi:hypothetical protein
VGSPQAVGWKRFKAEELGKKVVTTRSVRRFCRVWEIFIDNVRRLKYKTPQSKSTPDLITG